MGVSSGRKSIFITGAASGMGYQTAKLFAGKGWFIGGYDVNAEGLKALEAELGADNCVVRTLDVTDREDYRAALAEFAEATGGKMDILYNNAGIGGGGLFADLPFETVMAVVNTNFVGVLIGIHEGIKYLRQTPGSMCFTTSSSSATFGIPGIATYSATKHAVKCLTEALSIEFKAYGVKVADVLPGLIDTPIIGPDTAANAPKEGAFRAIPPVEVANVVWEAYHADVLHWYVPPEIFEMDKLATLEPEATRDRFLDGSFGLHLNAQVDKAGIYPK
jgi:NAD(P)-dependent dehydrogenase (short-subunit alcohol dehydrogenase family)